jgi:hypothetical protein
MAAFVCSIESAREATVEHQIELAHLRLPPPAPVIAAAIASLERDPVFALIEAHRQAMRDSTAANEAAEALAANKGEEDDSPEWIAANTARYSAWQAEDIALFEFLTTQPTTIAGALAALDHASSPQYPDIDVVEKFAAPVLFAATCTQDVAMVGAGAAFPTMLAAALRKLLEVRS